jgi:GNAT superfamily N-acetyltransferase
MERKSMVKQSAVHLDEINIRSATLEDAPTIGALWQELVDFHQALGKDMPIANVRGAKHYAQRIESQVQDSYSHVIVADYQGELVGFVVGMIVELLPDVFEAETNGFLADIYLKKDFRRSGIGQLMVQTLAKWFKSRGVERMEWYVAAQNSAGRAFWQEIGGRDVMVRMRIDL